MSSSAADTGVRLRRDLAAIQGVLALSMLMVDAETEADILALASSAIGSLPGGVLLGAASEDGRSLRDCPTCALRQERLLSGTSFLAADGTTVIDGVAVSAIPLRTHRARLGYLLVPQAAISATNRFLLEAIAHEVAVALSACEQRAALRDQARRLADSEARYRDLAERSPDAIWHVIFEPASDDTATSPETPLNGKGPERGDAHVWVDYLSPAFETLTGVAPSAVGDDAAALLAIVDPEQLSLISSDVLSRTRPTEARHERFFSTISRLDGTTVVVETQVAVTESGAQGIVRDMTEIGRLQAELTEMAVRDPLTGLANRRLLDELLEAALQRAKRGGAAVTVALLDLDHFKEVNDTYGHAAGDEVLRRTARRLREAVRASDVVARVGGDEFVIVFDAGVSGAAGVVPRIRALTARPIGIGDGRLVRCPPSIGLADTATVGLDAAALLAAADADMYAHKHH
jgi:diguanylate cyclase (GGDEF)-like protein